MKPSTALGDEMKRKKSSSLLDQTRALIVDQAAKKDLARASDGLIHASEVASSDWCSRRAFYRLTGEFQPEADRTHWRRASVFEEGEHAHRRKQDALKGVTQDHEGKEVRLFGDWLCLACGKEWTDDYLPPACDNCGAHQDAIRYEEVSVRLEGVPFVGHADAEVHISSSPDRWEDPVREGVEIKTVGPGTVRWYAPQLIRQFSCDHSILDTVKLWRSIQAPFPQHIRQASLYAIVRSWQKIHVWYDSKMDQDSKGFILNPSPWLVDALINDVKDTARAIETETVPDRPDWASSPTVDVCRECPAAKVCWSRGGTNGTTTRTPPSESVNRGGNEPSGRRVRLSRPKRV